MSVLAMVPAGALMAPSAEFLPSDPVLVHVTCCPRHSRDVQRYLRRHAPTKAEVWPMGTEYLLNHWDELVGGIDLRCFGLMRIGDQAVSVADPNALRRRHQRKQAG